MVSADALLATACTNSRTPPSSSNGCGAARR